MQALGLVSSCSFPQKRWLGPSQALKDPEVCNQAGKRGLYQQIPVQLCPLLSTFSARRFYTQLFCSANQQQEGPGF